MFNSAIPFADGAQYGILWASPTNTHFDYQKDCNRFAARGSPRVLIRQMFFEISDEGKRLFLPPLWVIVVELSPGFHMIYAFWRGQPFFALDKKDFRYAKISSGAEAFDIAMKAHERGRYDPNEWRAYLDRQNCRR